MTLPHVTWHCLVGGTGAGWDFRRNGTVYNSWILSQLKFLRSWWLSDICRHQRWSSAPRSAPHAHPSPTPHWQEIICLVVFRLLRFAKVWGPETTSWKQSRKSFVTMASKVNLCSWLILSLAFSTKIWFDFAKGYLTTMSVLLYTNTGVSLINIVSGNTTCHVHLKQNLVGLIDDTGSWSACEWLQTQELTPVGSLNVFYIGAPCEFRFTLTAWKVTVAQRKM